LKKPFKGKTDKSLSEKKSLKKVSIKSVKFQKKPVGPKGISNQKDGENSAEKV
jgi:hypothetical protein